MYISTSYILVGDIEYIRYVQKKCKWYHMVPYQNSATWDSVATKTKIVLHQNLDTTTFSSPPVVSDVKIGRFHNHNRVVKI
jgi:hypothetical protein